MSNHRIDLIYFVVFLLVLGGGFLAARFDDVLYGSEASDGEFAALPDFSLPSIEFEVPFELPYRFVRFARPEPPALVLADNVEGAIVEVRSALLESAALVAVEELDHSSPRSANETRLDTQLAAVHD